MAIRYNSTSKNGIRRASGALFGLALGDALGAKTEFMNVAEILHRFPPRGPLEPAGNPALVTDDGTISLTKSDRAGKLECMFDLGGDVRCEVLDPSESQDLQASSSKRCSRW